mgnify:CR=1 FL=1
MSKLIIRLLLVSLSIIAVSRFVPGIYVSSFYSALVVAVVLGLINIFLKPILQILTFPITVLTLGLFSLVLNAFLFWFVSTFVKGFTVRTASAAFIGALVVSLVNYLANHLVSRSF